MLDRSQILDCVRIIAWMIGPVLAGYVLWRSVISKQPQGHEKAAKASRILGRLSLIGFAAPMMLLAVWGAAPELEGKMWFLALIGLAVHVAGGAAGWGIARLRREPQALHGVYLMSGACSNVLTFGSITILLLLGTETDPEARSALGQMAIYRLAELPYYFLVVWPVAAVISKRGEDSSMTTREAIRKAFRGPQIAPVIGIVIGAALGQSPFELPENLDGLNQFLVRANVLALGVTVGLGLRRANPVRDWKPCLEMSGIKFLLMPAIGVGLGIAAGLDSTSIQVIAICASMPVAFMAVVGAVLYRLDDERIGSFWLFTTAAVVVVVPALAWVVPRLGE